MATLKEYEMRKVLSMIETIKGYKDASDTEKVSFNFAKTHGYIECLQSCQVISFAEANKFQTLAFKAKEPVANQVPSIDQGSLVRPTNNV